MRMVGEIMVFIYQIFTFWRRNSMKFTKFLRFQGDVYIGEWKGNIAHGIGIYYHKNSTTYEGQWVEEKIHQNLTKFDTKAVLMKF